MLVLKYSWMEPEYGEVFRPLIGLDDHDFETLENIILWLATEDGNENWGGSIPSVEIIHFPTNPPMPFKEMIDELVTIMRYEEEGIWNNDCPELKAMGYTLPSKSEEESDE